ncbi:MAG TPA: hypothetical protein VLB84_07945, partial [Bacteroidia bacterium]|nr:hypothetical protein [Bacteroidia bacterium]
YFVIFASAMERAGIREAHMVSSRYGDRDRQHLRAADILLLAGGDVHLGWQIMHQSALGDDVVEKHREMSSLRSGSKSFEYKWVWVSVKIMWRNYQFLLQGIMIR